LLLRLIGATRFRELAFLSPVLDAEQAAALGLARVVTGDLESEAMALAARLSEIAPLAIAGLKANIAAAETGDFAAAIAEEARNFARSQADPDHLEATRAFLEKRKPVFAFSAAGSK
jgi:enoyl-CoA hydratase/carnithine racemase